MLPKASPELLGRGDDIFGEEFAELSQSSEARLLSSDFFSIKLEVLLELDERGNGSVLPR
ncbi:MAG: hypothetical protein MUC83_18210 [Pirellula sp.]|jgi:hypothetical protein|nr:hypothetical protein [Pirellula sp.]